jgi:hypothetical protein
MGRYASQMSATGISGAVIESMAGKTGRELPAANVIKIKKQLAVQITKLANANFWNSW